MSHWSPQDWALFVSTVIVPLLAAVATLWKAISNNTKETTLNTEVTSYNTADRALKTAATVEQLSTIQTLVTDIHKGTGDGVVPIVVNPPAPPV